MKKRFTEEQIIGFLREAEAEMPVAELCRKYAFSEASYYLWRSKFGGRACPEFCVEPPLIITRTTVVTSRNK